MRFVVWLAGLGVLAGGAGCSSSTQPSEPELEGMTGAWVGVAPVLTATDSLGLFIADSAGTVSVFGRFNSGAYQQFTFAFTPSFTGALRVALSSLTPPFSASLDVRLQGSTLAGTYNDAAVTLTRVRPPAVPTGLWVRTSITPTPQPTYPTTDSIWIHADGRVHRKLEIRYDADNDCSNVGQGIPLNRTNSVVVVYLFLTTGSACNLPSRDSLIIQGSTLRRRSLTSFGEIEEVFEHRAQ
jgi:hypothetical protein